MGVATKLLSVPLVTDGARMARTPNRGVSLAPRAVEPHAPRAVRSVPQARTFFRRRRLLRRGGGDLILVRCVVRGYGIADMKYGRGSSLPPRRAARSEQHLRCKGAGCSDAPLPHTPCTRPPPTPSPCSLLTCSPPVRPAGPSQWAIGRRLASPTPRPRRAFPSRAHLVGPLPGRTVPRGPLLEAPRAVPALGRADGRRGANPRRGGRGRRPTDAHGRPRCAERARTRPLCCLLLLSPSRKPLSGLSAQLLGALLVLAGALDARARQRGRRAGRRRVAGPQRPRRARSDRVVGYRAAPLPCCM